LKAHVEEDWTGSRLNYAENLRRVWREARREGMVGDKRERKNGEKRVGDKREDAMRERDKTRRGGEEVGWGGRWRG